MLSLHIYFIKDKAIIATALLMCVALAGSWLMLFGISRPPEEDPFVVLFYTIYFGNQRLGAWTSLFIMPTVATVLVLIHGIAAYFLYDRERFWSYALMISGALVAVIIFLTSLFLLTINV